MLQKERSEESEILKTLDILLGPPILFKKEGYTLFCKMKFLKH